MPIFDDPSVKGSVPQPKTPQSLALWIFGVAAAYFVFGKLGLLLAIPPGFATPVWPPSGLSIIAVLVLGAYALPGVFLGSLLLNLHVSEAAAIENISQLIVPTSIAVGSSLQAALGAWLIKRTIGFPNALVNIPDTLLFAMIGGPIACVVAATVGVCTLYIFNVIESEALLYSWLTWWVGDSIGVLVFAPATLLLINSKHFNFHRRVQIGGPLLLILTIAITAFTMARSHEQGQIKAKFIELVQTEKSELLQAFEDVYGDINAVRAFYAGSQYVDRDEFDKFIDQITYSGTNLHIIEWLEKVTHDQREDFENKITQELGYSYRIWDSDSSGNKFSAKTNTVYFPIKYLKSQRINDTTVLGFNPYGNLKRKAAMLKSAENDTYIASEKITLVVDRTEAVIVYAPVFYNSPQKNTPVEGELSRVKGFIAAIVQIKDLAKHTKSHDLKFRIDDVTDSSEGEYIFGIEEEAKSFLSHEEVLEFAGRLWKVSYLPTNSFLENKQGVQSWLVLVGAFIFVWICSVLLLVITGREQMVTNEVQKKTLELNKAVNEAESANKTKSLFLASMSHELRTPLNSIIGFSNRLNKRFEQLELPERDREGVDSIYRNGVHLLSIINDILDISSIEADRMQLEENTVSIKGLLEDLSDQIDILCVSKPLNFSIDNAVPGMEIEADRRRVYQVLMNLVDNAFKYTDSGSVNISVRQHYHQGVSGVLFTIKDTGRGLTEEECERLFQRFSQAKSRINQRIEGTGLGIPLSKEFVSLHKGSIDVESELGIGSTFRVWLPREWMVDEDKTKQESD